MSRIGKKPIPLPPGVKVNFKDGDLQVQGPKGSLQRRLHPRITLEVAGNEIKVVPKDQDRASWRFWGLERSLVANMVTGVSEGFKKVLDIVGTGYKVEDKGGNLVFSLGYSHPIEFQLPPGIKAQVGDKGVRLTLEGADKEALGQTAAIIRRLRPPEPYKGKGIRYADEVVRRKVGKSGGK